MYNIPGLRVPGGSPSPFFLTQWADLGKGYRQKEGHCPHRGIQTPPTLLEELGEGKPQCIGRGAAFQLEMMLFRVSDSQ